MPLSRPNRVYNLGMRRLITLALMVVLSASVQLVAQRGGGGHGFGGGHSGFASHSGSLGHVAGGHAFAGAHSGSGFGARSSFHSAARSSSSHRTFSSRRSNHSRREVRTRSYSFRNNCYGYACRGAYGYPWLGGAFDPYGWDSGSSYDMDRERELNLADEMNAQSLDQQRMRQQGDQDLYARSAPPPPREEQHAEAGPATVLVFRDQRQREVQNYAIVGQTLWSFAPQRTEKIPLSSLDLAATTKANDERGLDFRLPNATEGQ